MVLAAVDAARAKEGIGPMTLPADFAALSTPVQMFIALDRERVDRGLAPVAGLSPTLDALAADGAASGHKPDLPPGIAEAASIRLDGVINGLDVVYWLMYQDGPDWSDRQVVLHRFGSPGTSSLGVAVDATPGRRNRPAVTLGAVLVGATSPTYTYTWGQAQADEAGPHLAPLPRLPANEATSGIADPPHNVAARPDYTRVCAGSGLDNSPGCTLAVLAALDRARQLEGVRPMALPPGFARLSVPEQLFVVINLERVDRGLPPFAGLTTPLDHNAQLGANAANDPPDPGPAYLQFDGEWAGGSSNALDAVYGWMYDDGPDSGNLDCPHAGAAGCWGHRKGILDDFGTGPGLVMGTAIDLHGDTRPDAGGTSMTATLAVMGAPVAPLVFTWAAATGARAPGGP